MYYKLGYVTKCCNFVLSQIGATQLLQIEVSVITN